MSLPRYSAYRESRIDWLPTVPSHWNVCALKRVASLKSGDSITSEQISEAGDYAVYGGNGLRGYTSAFTHEGRFALVGRQGALCGNVNYSEGKFWASEHAVVATPVKQANTTWLGELLRAMNLNQYSVSAAQPGLSVELISNLGIPYPPLEEQATIAAFLDHETAKIDGLIAEQEKLIALLAEKRQATISHAVTRGLNSQAPMKDSGVPWLGGVPAHWRVGKVQTFARRESGHTPSRQRPEYWENCTVPWFTLADVHQIRDGKTDHVFETKELVSELGLANSSARLLPKGTVMLSRTASVGYAAIMGVDMATTQDFVNWVCHDDLLPEFLLFVLRGMKSEFDRLMMGSTHQTIYMPDIAKLTMAQPPVDEQRQIVEALKARLKRLDLLAADATQAVGLLRERRSALIAAAVTGQIDVRGFTTG